MKVTPFLAGMTDIKSWEGSLQTLGRLHLDIWRKR